MCMVASWVVNTVTENAELPGARFWYIIFQISRDLIPAACVN